MNLFASIFAVLISFQVFAGDTSALFEELRDLPISYEQKGQICEQVARLQLDDIYPPHAYDINIGIEYIVHNRTIGELDVVVTDKQTRDVILIAEVKCWKNLKGALNKAKDQRSRFIRTLKSKPSEIVYNPFEGGHFESSQFHSAKFIAIAQQGAERFGFDQGLDYTLQELMDLRTQLMRCQSKGECARP